MIEGGKGGVEGEKEDEAGWLGRGGVSRKTRQAAAVAAVQQQQ